MEVVDVFVYCHQCTNFLFITDFTNGCIGFGWSQWIVFFII